MAKQHDIFMDINNPVEAARHTISVAGSEALECGFVFGAEWAKRVLGEDGGTALVPRKLLVEHFRQRIRDQEQYIDELRAQCEGVRLSVYDEILRERNRQDRKWGGPDHDDQHSPADWISYLAKHIGKAVAWPFDAALFHRQMVRVAALAVAAIEVLDRKAAAEEPKRVHRHG